MAINKTSDLTSTMNKWLNRFAPVLLLCAVIWLCWVLSRIVWLVLAPPQAPNLPNIARQSEPVQLTNATTFTIFAKANTQPVKTKAVAPTNIKVHGVMVANPREKSSALLSVGGDMKSYPVGKLIENTGYRLALVDWGEIVVEDNASNEFVLKMNEPMVLDQAFQSSNSQGGSIGIAPVMPIIQPSMNPAIPPAINYNGQTSNNGQQHNDSQNAHVAPKHNTTTASATPQQNADSANANNSNNKPAADNELAKFKKNPASYLSQVGVVATSEGYEVTAAMPADLRQKIGLEMGDTVLSVNGQRVGRDPLDDAELLSKVKQSHKASIQIKRGARIFTVNQEF